MDSFWRLMLVAVIATIAICCDDEGPGCDQQGKVLLNGCAESYLGILIERPDGELLEVQNLLRLSFEWCDQQSVLFGFESSGDETDCAEADRGVDITCVEQDGPSFCEDGAE